MTENSPGTCVVRRVDGEPHIDQADDHIEIAQDFLAKADDSPYMSFDGDVLTLIGRNRTVRYRVSPFNASPNAIYGLRAAHLIP